MDFITWSSAGDDYPFSDSASCAREKRAENLALIKASVSRGLSATNYIGGCVHVGKGGVHVTSPIFNRKRGACDWGIDQPAQPEDI